MVSIFERTNHRERERGEGEKKKKKKKRKRKKRRKGKSSQGMDSCMDFYDFWYGFYMESKDLIVLYGILENFVSSKPRV